MKLSNLFGLGILAGQIKAGPLPESLQIRRYLQSQLENICRDDNHLREREVHDPALKFPKPATVTFRDYLKPHPNPFGRDIAEWQAKVFGLGGELKYRTEPDIKPVRENAPTIVTLFYPNPDPKNLRRPTQVYLDRLQNMAKSKEQMIVYVPPTMAEKVRALRPNDEHFIVIDEYETIWDMPNNRHQQINFKTRQRDLFLGFDGFDESLRFATNRGRTKWHPAPAYDNPHLSAVYNAKPWVVLDAIMRNPFGSKRWAFFDAGMLDEYGPRDPLSGEPWAMIVRPKFLDEDKLDRAIELSGSTGVVMGEYFQNPMYGGNRIDNDCWTDPKRTWRCHHFIANAWVGTDVGQAKYSLAYFQTVDDFDANGFYTGREEFVVPHVAMRYPQVLFSVPLFTLPDEVSYSLQCPMKVVFSGWGGPEVVSPITDPFTTIFCPLERLDKIKPRVPNLEFSSRLAGLVPDEWFDQDMYESKRKETKVLKEQGKLVNRVLEGPGDQRMYEFETL